MGKVIVELNRDGVRELLQSPEMLAICSEYASTIAARAGTGYETSSYTGKTRVNASVYTATKGACKDNMKNNTLLKSLEV